MPQTTRSRASGPAVQRLQALAGTSPWLQLTSEQVRRQIEAFGSALFEVQPLPPKGVDRPKERIRTWTPAKLLEPATLKWLGRMNADGYDIYVRPAPPPVEGMAAPLVFVDDLSADKIRQLAADGLPLAVAIESSPANYHGWVRVGNEPLDRQEVTQAARLLAERYGGDPAAADWRHYGRLAGYTNAKPSRRLPNGRQPFASLVATSSEVAPAAEGLLADARQALEWAERARQRAEQERRSLATSKGGPAPAGGRHGGLRRGARAGPHRQRGGPVGPRLRRRAGAAAAWIQRRAGGRRHARGIAEPRTAAPRPGEIRPTDSSAGPSHN